MPNKKKQNDPYGVKKTLNREEHVFYDELENFDGEVSQFEKAEDIAKNYF